MTFNGPFQSKLFYNSMKIRKAMAHHNCILKFEIATMSDTPLHH